MLPSNEEGSCDVFCSERTRCSSSLGSLVLNETYSKWLLCKWGEEFVIWVLSSPTFIHHPKPKVFKKVQDRQWRDGRHSTLLPLSRITLSLSDTPPLFWISACCVSFLRSFIYISPSMEDSPFKMEREFRQTYNSGLFVPSSLGLFKCEE